MIPLCNETVHSMSQMIPCDLVSERKRVREVDFEEGDTEMLT